MRTDETIIIQNIPSAWTDVDIQKLCIKYGDMKDFIRFADCKSFALVTFDDRSSAESAVVKLPIDTDVGLEAYVFGRNSMPHSKSRSRCTIQRLGYEMLGNSICVVCNQNSKFICERCGDPYCSHGCQKRDWINHKKICFPLIHFTNN